ncbi:MAG: asparaginase [Chthoniobacterales bacterium]
MKSKIILIGFGGTIVSTHTEQGIRPVLDVENLLADKKHPSEQAEIVCEELFSMDSSKILAKHLLLLSKTVNAHLQNNDVQGVVITHGTDTLEETSYFLARTVPTKKAICFTAAQRPANDPEADGPANLSHALAYVASPAASACGVCVVMNGHFHTVSGLRKNHTSALDAFVNQNEKKKAFAEMIDEQVCIHHVPKNPPPINLDHLQLPLPRVDIIYDFPGSDGSHLRASLAAGARGLVVQALGAGNVSKENAVAIKEALQKKIPVMLATRVPFGKLFPKYGGEGGGRSLREAGCLFPDEALPASQARIELQLSLAQNLHLPNE